MDAATALKDCEIADEQWTKLGPQLRDWPLAEAICVLASRAKPLADHCRTLLAANAKLIERDREWWRAATAYFEAEEGTLAEGEAIGALSALKLGSGWSDVPEPVAKLMCDQRDAALAEAARLRAECDALRRFKEYVHARLTRAGVSLDPASPHRAEGCRVGGRLDEVFAERDVLRSLVTGAHWLVWSNEHRAWWGPNRSQYYWDVTAAGRYTLDEALKICTLRGVARGDGINPPELIQPSPEWLAARAAAVAKLARAA